MIQTGPGSPQAFSTANGGKVWPFNNINAGLVQILAINPSRQSITFHNPGTVNVYVFPMTTATGALLVPSFATLGGCFLIFPGGLLTITGECQQAWGAFSAVTAPLTVMESNI